MGFVHEVCVCVCLCARARAGVGWEVLSEYSKPYRVWTPRYHGQSRICCLIKIYSKFKMIIQYVECVKNERSSNTADTTGRSIFLPVRTFDSSLSFYFKRLVKHFERKT